MIRGSDFVGERGNGISFGVKLKLRQFAYGSGEI